MHIPGPAHTTVKIAELLDSRLVCTKDTIHIIPKRGPILDLLNSSRLCVRKYATELSRQIILKGLAARGQLPGKGRKDMLDIPCIIDLEATLGNLKCSKPPF